MTQALYAAKKPENLHAERDISPGAFKYVSAADFL